MSTTAKGEREIAFLGSKKIKSHPFLQRGLSGVFRADYVYRSPSLSFSSNHQQGQFLGDLPQYMLRIPSMDAGACFFAQTISSLPLGNSPSTSTWSVLRSASGFHPFFFRAFFHTPYFSLFILIFIGELQRIHDNLAGSTVPVCYSSPVWLRIGLFPAALDRRESVCTREPAS